MWDILHFLCLKNLGCKPHCFLILISAHLGKKCSPHLDRISSKTTSLFQCKKPCSPSKVRVHRLCRLNDSMLHPRLSCPTTSTKEVTNESISKISTNHMALPISYCVGAQIPFQDSNWQSCEDGRELRESLFRATKLWRSRTECSDWSCSYCCDGSPPRCRYRTMWVRSKGERQFVFLTNSVI